MATKKVYIDLALYIDLSMLYSQTIEMSSFSRNMP